MEQPSSVQEGDIWISTQNSSAIAFDALKENNLIIYPLDAYQYLNNAWVKKPMAIYKNGKWETGDLVLYDGVEWNSDYSYTLSYLTLAKNDGYLSLNRQNGGNGYFDIIIDLTGYDSIEIDAQGAVCYGSMWYAIMKNGEELVVQEHGDPLEERKQFTIPVTDLSGSHTFRYGMWSSNGFTSKLYSLVLKKS